MRKPTDLALWPGSVYTGYLYSIHGFGSEIKKLIARRSSGYQDDPNLPLAPARF
jgi:hypothetical protein